MVSGESTPPDPVLVALSARDTVLVPAPAAATRSALKTAAKSAVETPDFSTEAPTPARRSIIRRVSAFGGAAALGLAFATAGVITPADETTSAALASQQQLGTGSSSATAYELIGEVAAESASVEALTSFTNFTDAEVQYPFASGVPLTDGFGERVFPVAGFHDAQDFAAAFGTPVQAIANGTVVEAGWTTDGCGFGIKLEHAIDGQEVTSRYCHMVGESHALQIGDVVSVGQEVGRVGATGIAFGAHLHFVITVNGEAIDPMPYLLAYNRSTRS